MATVPCKHRLPYYSFNTFLRPAEPSSSPRPLVQSVIASLPCMAKETYYIQAKETYYRQKRPTTVFLVWQKRPTTSSALPLARGAQQQSLAIIVAVCQWARKRDRGHLDQILPEGDVVTSHDHSQQCVLASFQLALRCARVLCVCVCVCVSVCVCVYSNTSESLQGAMFRDQGIASNLGSRIRD